MSYVPFTISLLFILNLSYLLSLYLYASNSSQQDLHSSLKLKIEKSLELSAKSKIKHHSCVLLQLLERHSTETSRKMYPGMGGGRG
jgi:hypothetical protein